MQIYVVDDMIETAGAVNVQFKDGAGTAMGPRWVLDGSTPKVAGVREPEVPGGYLF